MSISNAQLFLTTRLLLPRLPVQHVSRPRLLALLDEGTRGTLTLVSAPAGSGKTTLLAEWGAMTELPVAWIALEATDNDPLSFLTYFMAAMVGLDERIDSAFQAYQVKEHQGFEVLLTALLNDLARLLQHEVVLILDDYHLLTSEAVQALVRFLLEHLPTLLHLVIGTRSDPVLPLARLRAHNQLREIRLEDLRFGPGEVEALLHTMGLMLSDEATGLLEQRTEGWVAGIQLLALALRGQPEVTSFLRTFRGTHRFLIDYVSEEVLAQQTEEMQRFLLRSSVLEKLTGSLCETVTELPHGQARLAELLHANLFVSALDETGSWYRYHALFASALRVHLQRQEPELVPELYLRASRWYEQHQQLDEACEYAFKAEDLTRVVRLLSELLPSLVEQGRFARLQQLLAQLPPSLIASSPQLYITMPWMYQFTKHTPEHIEQTLQGMEQYVQQQQHRSASWVEPQSMLALLRAVTALSQNQLSSAFTLAREALQMLGKRETALSQLLSRFLRIFLGLAYGASGDLATAERMLVELSIIPNVESFSLVNLAASFLLGELYKAQGHLRKLKTLYEDVLQRFEVTPSTQPLPLMLQSFILMRSAVLFYEWNALPEAEKSMRQVLELLPRVIPEIIPRSSQTLIFTLAPWVQARIELAQGRPKAAQYFLELIRKQAEIPEEPPPGKEGPVVDLPTLVARLALLCGQLEDGIRWENSSDIRFNDAPITLIESRQVFAYLTLARVLIARGRNWQQPEALERALALLEHWRNCAMNLGFQGWQIEVQMLTALALQVQGRQHQALDLLGDALALAEPEGYIRLFADEGQPMALLLAQVSEHTTASLSYIQKIQATILPASVNVPGHMLPEREPVPLDPLSSREKEVLLLLARGVSNQQIADTLVISLNTAKRHVKHILAKLGVSNRTQALVRARELGLL